MDTISQTALNGREMEIARAARTTRQVADQAERIATALEQVRSVLGTPTEGSRQAEGTEEEVVAEAS